MQYSKTIHRFYIKTHLLDQEWNLVMKTIRKRLYEEYESQEQSITPAVLDEDDEYYEIENKDDYKTCSIEEKADTIKSRELIKALHYNEIDNIAEFRIKKEKEQSCSLNDYDSWDI